MITLYINGQECFAEQGESVLDVALNNNIDITHLCYDKRLNHNGECGLCLVEIQGQDGLVLSCQTLVHQGLEVLTNTPKVQEAVRKRLEKLLKNHPVACSSCTKAGRCELQKLCVQLKPKIKASPKTCQTLPVSLLIDCVPDKCIDCKKCMTFLKKAGVSSSNLQTPPQQIDDFMLAGSLINLCPSGALIASKNKQFCPVWNRKEIQSIDVSDGFCSDILIATKNDEVIEITPTEKQNFISDKARFFFDGLRVNRLDRPYIRVNGKLKEASWTEAFEVIALNLNATDENKRYGFVGNYADCESMLALKDLFGKKNISVLAPDFYAEKDSPQTYRFNTAFTDIDKADVVLVVGADLKIQAPNIDFILRQKDRKRFSIGQKTEKDSIYTDLGNNPQILKDLLDKNDMSKAFLTANNPLVILGDSVFYRTDSPALLDLIYQFLKKYNVIRSDWNGYNFLTNKVSCLGGFAMGLGFEKSHHFPLSKDEIEFAYLLQQDTLTKQDLGDCFVVYQGIYASKSAMQADVLLPALSFMEKNATYVSLEGVAKNTKVVSSPPFQAREDWKILRALSEYIGKLPLPYDTLPQIRDALGAENVLFYEQGKRFACEDTPFGKQGDILDTPLEINTDIFDDEVSRQSQNMILLKKGLK